MPTCLPSTSQAQWPAKWSSVLVMSCFYNFHYFDTSTSTGTSTSTSTSTRVCVLVPVHAVHSSTPVHTNCPLAEVHHLWVCLPNISGATTAFLDALGVHISLISLPNATSASPLGLFTKHLWGDHCVSGRSESPHCWIWLRKPPLQARRQT